MSNSATFPNSLVNISATDSAAETVQSEVRKEPSNVYKFGLAMFFIAFGFDFKDRGYIDYANIIRVLIVATSLIGFVLAVYSREPIRKDFNHRNKIEFVFWVWAVYLIYIVSITAIRSPISYEYLRATAPYGFMLLSMILMKRHIEAGYSSESFWKYILYMGLISTAWNFYFGRYASRTYSEDDVLSFIDDVRYSILSSSLLPLFSIAFYNLSRFQKVIPNFILLFILMFLFLVSKSRLFLMGIVCVLLYSIFTSPYRNRASALVIIATFVVLIGSSFVGLVFRNFDLIGVWAFRFGVANQQFVDITWYTRLAEYKSQLNLLFSDIQSAIFGYGFLKETFWDASIFDELLQYGYRGDYYDTYSVAGHSTWITSLFQTGIIMGSIPFLSFTYLFVVAVMQIFKRKEIRDKMDLWGGIALGMIVSAWIPSNFSSFFIDRIFPMIIGAAIIQATHEHHRLKQIERNWIFRRE